MTHSVFRWWTFLKVKPFLLLRSSLIWCEVACLWAAGKTSWVGGLMWTVRNCCHCGFKHLEVRDAGSRRVLWNFTRSTYVRGWAASQTVRRAEEAREAITGAGTFCLYSLNEGKWKFVMCGARSPYPVSPDSASCLLLLNLFTLLRFHPMSDSQA